MNTDRYKTPLPRAAGAGVGAGAHATSSTTGAGTGIGIGTSTRLPLPSTTIPPNTSLRSTAIKRDTLAAELERDPHLSTPKRHQRTALFSSTLSHASLERQLLALQTSKSELETKLRERDAQIERLEADRRWLAEREREEREGRERERGEWEEGKKQTETELRTLRSTLSTLQNQLADLQDAYSTLSLSSSQTASKHQSTITALTHTNTLLTSQLSSLQTQLSSCTSELTSLQAQHQSLLEHKDAEAKSAREEEDVRVVREELGRQAGYLTALERAKAKLEKELSVLRARQTSVEVLKEEKRGLEERVRMLEVLGREGVKAKAKEKEGKETNNEDGSSTHPSASQSQPLTSPTSPTTPTSPPPSPPPITHTQTLTALRLTHAQLLIEHGQLKALLSERTALLSAAAQREEGLERRVGELEREVGREREGRRRAEVGRGVGEREVRFLKDLVASYNAEAQQQQSQVQLQAQVQSPSSSSQVAQVAQVDPQHQHLQRLHDRIQHLESLLAEYKAVNLQLGEELDALVGKPGDLGQSVGSRGQGQGSAGQGEVKTLLGQLEEMKKENTELKEALKTLTASEQSHLTQIDALEQTLFELRGEIAGGRHVPPHTRVLQLADNPETRWFEMRKEAMERLRRENEALMRRLREVEGWVGGSADAGAGGAVRVGEGEGEGEEKMEGDGQGGQGRRGSGGAGPGADLVPRESWEIVQKEKSELEELLKQKEKRLLRLQQVYQSKSAEFREAIASLLGLKLAFYPNGQVRVTSIYDLCASFVFQPSRSGSGQGGVAGGTMQLIAQGEGGPQELPDLMRYWIEGEQCIPGFLASVTLECYDKVKRESGQGVAMVTG